MTTIEELSNLSDDELIVAVAEAKGWKSEEHKVSEVCGGGTTFVLINPAKERCEFNPQRPTLKDWKWFLPDYRQPAEYMALMGEIWKKDQNVYIKSNLIGGIPARDDVLIYGHYWDDTSTPAACKELWRAICIAWLVICGGKDE